MSSSLHRRYQSGSVGVLTCSYPALLLLRVLLALLDCRPFLDLQHLLDLQPFKRIWRVISWHFLYGDHRGRCGDGGLLFGPPPLLSSAVVIFSAVAVAHVVETEVFDFVTGPAIRAVATVLLLLGLRVLKAKQVQLTVLLRLGLGLPEPAERTSRGTALIFC